MSSKLLKFVAAAKDPAMKVVFADDSSKSDVPACKIRMILDGYEFEQHAYQLETPSEFDIILGQDWIQRHAADLLCSKMELRFSETNSGKKHAVPVPIHLREQKSNGMISNAIAEVRASVLSGENAKSDDPVTHMLMVYVSQSAEALGTPTEVLRDAIAASVSIDSMLPHTEQVHAQSAIHLDTDDTNQEGLFVETEQLRAEVKKIVDESLTDFHQICLQDYHQSGQEWPMQYHLILVSTHLLPDALTD